MKPYRAKNRPKWLLGRCATFCRNFGWWPSAPELAAYVRGHWSRWTIRRDLSGLRAQGVLESVGRNWRVTDSGFEVLRLPAIVAKKKRPGKPLSFAARRARRMQRRLDAVKVLDLPETID